MNFLVILSEIKETNDYKKELETAPKSPDFNLFFEQRTNSTRAEINAAQSAALTAETKGQTPAPFYKNQSFEAAFKALQREFQNQIFENNLPAGFYAPDGTQTPTVKAFAALQELYAGFMKMALNPGCYNLQEAKAQATAHAEEVISVLKPLSPTVQGIIIEALTNNAENYFVSLQPQAQPQAAEVWANLNRQFKTRLNAHQSPAKPKPTLRECLTAPTTPQQIERLTNHLKTLNPTELGRFMKSLEEAGKIKFPTQAAVIAWFHDPSDPKNNSKKRLFSRGYNTASKSDIQRVENQFFNLMQ